MIVSKWISSSTKILSEKGIPSSRLDSEMLLAHALNKPRTWIHAHGNDEINAAHLKLVDAMLELRVERVPIAYIIGHKEFYGRTFTVTPSTLVPRPESEDLVDIILSLKDIETLIDIGSGSGAIGISVKLKNPSIDTTLSDVSLAALAVATENAQNLHADVDFIVSDLLSSMSLSDKKFSMIVANLPYVDDTWETSPELKYEPVLALYADNQGLALIYSLLEQAPNHLLKNGYVLLESDPVQHQQIIDKAKTYGLKHIKTVGYGVLLQTI